MKLLDVASVPAVLRIASDPALARIEDAGLAASQPREQAFHDGWLLRYANGKAKRARSVNPIGAGRLPLADKLGYCAAFYQKCQLPFLMRVTPFSQPPGIDDELARRGFVAFEDTRVMVLALDRAPTVDHPSIEIEELDAERFGMTLAVLHGLDAARAAVERDRFARSALHGIYRAVRSDGALVACGSVAIEGEFAGIFGMVTAASSRGRGIATALLAALLGCARERGCATAYLQVDCANAAARKVYGRFGFADRYAYWYRMPPPKEPGQC